MNKLLIIITVMAITAPSFAADVDFAATQGPDGNCVITYTVNAGTIRGMALNIDADTDISAATVDSFFDVFMDAAYMDPANYVLGAGTPIADQDAAGELALPLSSFCLSVGNLEGVATANEIVLSAPTGTTGTLDINTLRGGIVNTDGVSMTTNLPIDLVFIHGDCFVDPNGDGKISAADLAYITAFLSPAYADTDPPYTADPIPEGAGLMDANQDGRISAADLAFIVAFLSPAYADTDPPYTYNGCL